MCNVQEPVKKIYKIQICYGRTKLQIELVKNTGETVNEIFFSSIVFRYDVLRMAIWI